MKSMIIKGYVKANKDDGTFSVIASTSTIDRQGESIDQAGWELDAYRKNPVILWAHRYDMLPVGVAEELIVDERGLVINGRFAKEDANPFAQQVRRLYEDGILSTVSVGFIPKERNGNVITRSELLELSFVPVPANPEALSLLAAVKGADDTLKAEITNFTFAYKDADPAIEPTADELEAIDADDTLEEEEIPAHEEMGDEKVATKPNICEPDDPAYDPQACAAIFCDPKSPEYNQEFCDLMKGDKSNDDTHTTKVGRVISAANRKKIEDAIGALKG